MIRPIRAREQVDLARPGVDAKLLLSVQPHHLQPDRRL
jgi:hypothetical protein